MSMKNNNRGETKRFKANRSGECGGGVYMSRAEITRSMILAVPRICGGGRRLVSEIIRIETNLDSLRQGTCDTVHRRHFHMCERDDLLKDCRRHGNRNVQGHPSRPAFPPRTSRQAPPPRSTRSIGILPLAQRCPGAETPSAGTILGRAVAGVGNDPYRIRTVFRADPVRPY